MCDDKKEPAWLNSMLECESNELKYDDIFIFIMKFARYEYAIKMNGYVCVNDKKIITGVNWNKYEAKIQKKNISLKDKEIKKILCYLDMEPVKQYIYDNNVISLNAMKPDGNDIVRLSVYLRRIRNNLFHGMKFYSKLNEDLNERLSNKSSRTSRLISFGIKIIDFLVSLDSDLHNDYVDYV